MKILYAIQGTGNGHITRAMEIVPELRKRGQVDVLISGIQSDIRLPFPVRYRFNGLSFIFGKKGGIDFLNTYRRNKIRRFLKEVKQLSVAGYDLVISDFEPISAWACMNQGKPCIGLSNQAALLTPGAPQATKQDVVGRFILRNYAPCTHTYGFHFDRYNPNVYTPIVRSDIREMELTDEGHYTVYLPAYDDQRIIKHLKNFPEVDFEVFSKNAKRKYYRKNVFVRPIESRTFLRSFASCSGIICAAGFGTTSEALYLGKKMLVIPQRAQFEQQCNAIALAGLGVEVVKSLKSKHLPAIENWIGNGEAVQMNYPNNVSDIVADIIDRHYLQSDNYIRYISTEQYYLRPA